MRQPLRSLIVLVVALLGVIGIGVASAFGAAVALAASALIVQGTGTPDSNIVRGLKPNARDYYLGTTPCNNATDCPDGTLTGINYPASFFPLAFIPRWCVPGRCEKWDVSVGTGVTNLNTALQPYLVPGQGEDLAIFGYSQGAAVVSNELRALKDLDLTPEQKAKLSVVLIGNIDNPDGGLFTRLGIFGRVPFIDVTTGLPTPIDTGIKLTTINFEYDGVGDMPRYWGNPLAVANGILGFVYIHGTYLDPNQNGNFTGLPNGYTKTQLLEQQNCGLHPTNCRQDQFGNDYILIPTKTLPLVMPLLDIAHATGTGALIKPLVDLISPTLRVLIDLGYDRTVNPGTYAPLSVLPFNPFKLNPVQVTADLIRAALEGVQAALGLPPAVRAPVTTPTLVAAKSAATAKVAATPIADVTTPAPKADEPKVVSAGAQTATEDLAKDLAKDLPTESTEDTKADAEDVTDTKTVTTPVETKDPKKNSVPGSVSLSFAPGTTGAVTGSGSGTTVTTPVGVDEPVVEKTKTEAPKSETPTSEAPKTETPKTDSAASSTPTHDTEKAAA